MPKNLSDALIRAIQPPKRGQITVVDGTLPNFGVRVSQGGTKTFIVTLGKGKRHTLGRYPILSLADARAEAKRILAEKTLGHIRPARAIFEECRDEYLKECERRLKPGTLKLYRYHLARDYPFGRLVIADITPRQIIENLNRCTPSMKEHAARIGRSFFTWAVRNHYLESSPMARMQPVVRGKSRDRVLTDEELKAILQAAQRLSSAYAQIIRLLVYTGQRRGEIAALRWAWIDEEAKTITFPPGITKNGLVHTIPYGETVTAILSELNQFTANPHAFPAMREKRRGQPATIFNSWSKNKVLFDEECGVTDWTLHDIRRTVSTQMAALGVPQVVVEKLLNHVTGGSQSQIAAIYNRHQYLEEMRVAVKVWENHLAMLTNLPSTPEVA